MNRSLLVLSMSLVCAVVPSGAQENRKEEYVHGVVRGAGLMPWQEPGPSDAESRFRAEIEARKDALLAKARPDHPSYYDAAAIARARDNVATQDWAQQWLRGQVAFADEIVAQPDGWIISMIPMEAPSHAYGFTCPVCVGTKSQEGVGDPLVQWNYRNPDAFSCRSCGTLFPNDNYPETQVLQLPRTGHSVNYYMNPSEQAQPEDRSGKLAWHWVGYPIHNSFTGIIRERKIAFMRDAVQCLGLAYLFTEDARYAITARDILVRFAACYRQWPYRDYWDTYADCDPLYAAWHDKALPIEWKRHLSEQAYADDTMERASMLQTYWGAGRLHPSTDNISGLTGVVQAYDFTCNATGADGTPVWDVDSRCAVERDFILEWVMGAEPYVGGPGKADEDNNKSPRVYNAMAAVGKCLGIPEYVDVALRGYERVRDGSFLFDGFSSESPSYTAMYLSQLLIVPETLYGYRWPADFTGRSGTVDLYAQDPKLGMMYRSVLDTLLPDGRYLPLSDTRLPTKPPEGIVQMGTRRYPEYYHGMLASLYKNSGDEYAVFNLSHEALTETRPLPLHEIYHPAWKTAVLRQGMGADGDTLTLAFNPPGGHRHYDNLALFYADGDRTLASDLGYLGDMPVNRWIRSTASHNLVVVDGEEQSFSGRKTDFGFMVTSPMASVVEARSNAYPQCSDYRRRVVLVKINESETFAIDLFSVAGGSEHRYRAISELASSDHAEGVLEFNGVAMPEEAPLPKVGASLADADIYGLRDVRSGTPDGDVWQAIWREDDAACRLWMVGPVDSVEAANAPGQRTHEEAGRRVRVVDALRRGEALQSNFASVRESSHADVPFPVQSVRQCSIPGATQGVALKIESATGIYHALNNFNESIEVDGIRFLGKFALIWRGNDGEVTALAVEAGLLEIDGKNLTHGSPCWRSTASTLSDSIVLADVGAPPDWQFNVGSAQAFAKVSIDGDWTAYPIKTIDGSSIAVERFPLKPVEAMEIPAVVFFQSHPGQK